MKIEPLGTPSLRCLALDGRATWARGLPPAREFDSEIYGFLSAHMHVLQYSAEEEHVITLPKLRRLFSEYFRIGQFC